MKFSDQRTTVTSSISSTVAGLRTSATLPALPLLAAAFLAGGFHESTSSLLAAAVWLGIAIAAALRPPPRPSPAFWALAALGGWTALSATWGPAGPALRALPLVALYAGALLAAEWAAPAALLRATWLACVLVSAAALAGWIAGVGDRGRLEWPVTYTNGLGLVAVAGVLLTPGNRLLLGAVPALAAVFTFSRSALLAGAAGLVVLAAGRGRIPKPVAAGAAVGAVALAVVLAQPLAARFSAPAPDEGDARRLLDVSGHGRAELWSAAWHEWLDAPLLGRGAGTYARAAVERSGELSAPANAHSLYLETPAELGVVGLALVAAFLALTLPRLRASPPAGAVVAAWAVHAAVDWDWQLPAATLPAVLAAGALARTGRPLGAGGATAVAAAALAVGALTGLHGVGAALLESGRPARAEPLLPFDARPAAARGDLERACRIDPGEPALRRAPPFEGCDALRDR